MLPEPIQNRMQQALLHHQVGRLADARTLYMEILALQPEHADATHALGLLALQAGQYDDALRLIQRAIQLDASAAHYHSNLGHVLKSTGRIDEAIAALRHCIKLNPLLAPAYHNLGIALHESRRLNEAADAHRQFVALEPDSVDGWHHLGNVLHETDALDDAIDAYRHALRIAPTYEQSWNNLGLTYHAAGRFEEAIRAFEQTLLLRPDWPLARYNFALTLLLLGRLEQGWDLYDSRRHAPELSLGCRRFDRPMWDGSRLDGRRILLHAEQGLGDTIQFVRYARLVADLGGRIVLACDPRLVRVMQRLPWIERVIDHDPPASDFDVHAPLMSLPRVFKTTVETIPAIERYLTADPELARQYQSRMPPDPRPKVTLTWAGRPDHLNDHRRSIPAAALDGLGACDRVQFIPVQPGSVSRPNLNSAGFDFELRDFADTAALIANIDLVITVDTSVAHLAGAMGLKTWVLLPFVPDWRWLLGRADSPWYPSVTLFRQPRPGDWETPLREIMNRLMTGTIR